MIKRVVARAALVVVIVGALSSCGEDGAGTRVGTEGDSGSPSGSERVTADIQRCPQPSELGASDSDAADDKSLPDVELDCLGPGDPVLMSGLQGRPRVVNVWASWCAPCQQEMPWLQRAHDTGEVAVLGVDAEDQTGAASQLLHELDVSYPSVFDPGNHFAQGVGVVTKPMSLLVAPDGRVVRVVPGAFESYEQLVQMLDESLGVDLQ